MKIVGSAFKIWLIDFSPNPRPNILDAPAILAILAFANCFAIDVLILVAIFSLKPSTFNRSSNDALIIFGIEFAPLAIIFSTFASPKPSTSNSLKNLVIDLASTLGSAFTFVKIKSTFVSFHTYLYSSTFGNIGFCAGTITSVIFGITFPLLVRRTKAPNPILLSTINRALIPVAYVIVTPPIWTGSNWTRGFSSPSLDAAHSTSNTLASKTWSVNIILNANACSGFLLSRGCKLSSIQIIPSIVYS